MNEGLSIQQADPHDESVVTLMRALAEEEAIRYVDLGPDTFDSFRPDDVLAGRGAFLIARLDGQAVGCGALRQMEADSAEVNRMYVVPAARRRGVARAILL
jgi:GNAT superfamily N-acetyltransferase